MEELRLRRAHHGGGYAVFEDFETLLFVGSLDECLSFMRGRMLEEAVEVTDSCGDVFADLGLRAPDELKALLKRKALWEAGEADRPLSESPLFKDGDDIAKKRFSVDLKEGYIFGPPPISEAQYAKLTGVISILGIGDYSVRDLAYAICDIFDRSPPKKDEPDFDAEEDGTGHA